MSFRLIGAIMVVAGCGGTGVAIALNHRRVIRWLRDLVRILEFMEAELSYQRTPLPVLCRKTAALDTLLKPLMTDLSDQLEQQVSPEAEICMKMALANIPQMPIPAEECLIRLGACFGKFDLHGQLQEIASVRTLCNSKLSELESGQDVRLRTYQTMGFCIGAALVVLLI